MASFVAFYTVFIVSFLWIHLYLEVSEGLQCPADITLSDPNPPQYVVPTTSPNDLCSGFNYTELDNADRCNRDVYRTWSCGNDICTQRITVEDNMRPVISCPSDVDLEYQKGDTSYTDPENTGIPDCTGGTVGDNSLVCESTETHGCEETMTITRHWACHDACAESESCTQHIYIHDTTPPQIYGCPDDTEITIIKGDSWKPPEVTCSNHGLIQTVTLDQCNVEFYQWECRDDCGNSNSCSQTVNLCAHTDAPTASPTDAPTAYYDYFDVGDIIYLKAVACNQYLRDRESYSRISLTSTRDQNRQRWKISDVQDIGGIRKVKLVNYHDIANNRGLWIENGDLKTNKNKGDWFSFKGYKSGDKFYVNMENGGKCPYWGGCGDGRVSMDSKGCNDNYKIEVEFYSGGNDMVEYFEFNNKFKVVEYLLLVFTLVNFIWTGFNYKTKKKGKQDYEEIAQKNDV